jgi:hypothetical protein
MTLAMVYWIVVLLWLILGVLWPFPRGENASYLSWGSSVLLFILLVVVGLKLFGSPIQGG